MFEVQTIPNLIKISDAVYKDKDWNATLLLCKQQSHIDLLYKEILKNKERGVAFDFEAKGIEEDDDARDPMQAEPIGCSFGTVGVSGYVYLDSQDDSRWNFVKKILQDDTIRKIAHNAKYDVRVAYHYTGIKTTPLVFDTMAAHHLLNELKGTHDLKQVATKMLGIDGFKYKKIVDTLAGSKFKLDTVAPEIAGLYGASDSFMTFKIKEVEEELLRKEGMSDLVEFVMNLVFVLTQMEIRGVKINQKYMEELGVELSKSSEESLQKVYKLVGKEFNPGSSKQLQEVLYSYLGINPQRYGIRKNKTGYSTDAESLDLLAGVHPVVDVLLDYRKYEKLNSTYVEGIKKRLKDDGKIRTSWLIHGTVSGRLSSKNPNMQNIPRGDKIKKMFIAQDGYKIVKMDYSQIELRVMAYYSQDPEMMRIFSSGEDIHSEVARQVFNLPCKASEVKEKYKEKRTQAKGVNFGILYGRGDKSLAKEINCSVQDAANFIAKWWQWFKAVGQFKEQALKQFEKDEYVANIFGRRRRFSGYAQLKETANSGDMFERTGKTDMLEGIKREVFNFIIQSTAVDLCNMALVRAYMWAKENGYDINPLWQVHDELGFEIAEGDLDKVKELEGILIQKPDINVFVDKSKQEFNIPLEVETVIADSWGG